MSPLCVDLPKFASEPVIDPNSPITIGALPEALDPFAAPLDPELPGSLELPGLHAPTRASAHVKESKR
jgi:hypothetical protein